MKENFPRLVSVGIGIGLLEFAGCQEDRLGITIVSGLVKGGSAEGTDIQPGDSHPKVFAIVQKIALNYRIAKKKK